MAANGSRSGWQPYCFSKALLPVRLRLDIFLNQNHRTIIDMSAMRPIVTQRKDEHSIINLMVQSKVSAVTGVYSGQNVKKYNKLRETIATTLIGPPTFPSSTDGSGELHPANV